MNENVAVAELFKSHNVYAIPGRPKVTPASAMVPIRLKPGEKIDKVKKLIPEIALALSNIRLTDTPVRLHERPLYLDIPHARPRPIMWGGGKRQFSPGHMLAGRSWSFKGGEDQWVNLDREPHVLVGGITGSGKSVMIWNQVLSLCYASSPNELEVILVDLKNEDMVPLKDLPHVRQFAGDPESAISAVKWVHDQVEVRRDSHDRPGTRVLLVIDELAQLPDEAKGMLQAITALGRSMLVNVLSATQHPISESFGGSLGKVNYVARFTGMVATAQEAQTVAGRPQTGAEHLPGDGSFIRTGGPGIVRLQSFMIEWDQLLDLVSQIRLQWGAGQAMARQVTIPEVVSVPRSAVYSPETDPELRGLEAVFSQYYDGAGGLKYGGMKQAILAMFGEQKRGRGYDEQSAKIQACLQEWLTSPDPVEILT